MVRNLVSIALDLHVQQKQTVQNFRLLSCRYAQFYFLEKGPGLVSSSHFVYNFSRKMFRMLCFIN